MFDIFLIGLHKAISFFEVIKIFNGNDNLAPLSTKYLRDKESGDLHLKPASTKTHKAATD